MMMMMMMMMMVMMMVMMMMMMMRRRRRRRMRMVMVMMMMMKAMTMTMMVSQGELQEGWMAKDGEHAWLEDVEGERALSWVKEQNTAAVEALGDPKGGALYDRVLSIMDSKDKIPHVRHWSPPLLTVPQHELE